MLARLSVFAGGCTLEAAEAVCSSAGIDEGQVLDLLSTLVARSLVVAEDAPSGERRYRLLETIRQYAEEKVDDAERAGLRDRHADFYVDFAEKAGVGLRGPEQLRWTLEVESALENVRAAMAWSIATNDTVRAARFLCSTTTVVGLLTRVVSATLKRYSSCRASRRSSCTRSCSPPPRDLPCFTACSTEPTSSARRHSMRRTGRATSSRASRCSPRNARYGLGDMTGAIQGAEGSVNACRRFGDPYMLAFSLSFLANMRPRGSTDLGADEAREALALAREIGAPGVISGGLATLAIVLLGTDPEQSRTLIAESIALHDALGVIVVNENALVMQILVSAVLGEREQTLRLTARGLDRGFSMLVTSSACLEATAETLSHEQPDVAVTLQGTVDALVPSLVHAEPYRALRKRASVEINTHIDAGAVNELRARGAALTEDQATAYALDAIHACSVTSMQSRSPDVAACAGQRSARRRASRALAHRSVRWPTGASRWLSCRRGR